MPTTKTDLTQEWTQIAADISAVSLVQISGPVAAAGVTAELLAAGSAPAPTDNGVELRTGEAICSAQLPDLGAGGLYARAKYNGIAVVLVT